LNETIIHPNNTQLSNSNRDKLLIEYILDSGATRHICYILTQFTKIRATNLPIILADGSVIYAIGIGAIGSLHPVFYAPKFKYNLISVSQLTLLTNHNVIFTATIVYARHKETKIQLEIGKLNSANLYTATHTIFALQSDKTTILAHTASMNHHELWHHRLNHANDERLRVIHTHNLATGYTYHPRHQRPFCNACALAKHECGNRWVS
jgi:hypothetical protein